MGQHPTHKPSIGNRQCLQILYSSAKTATVVETYAMATMAAQKVRLTRANTAKGRALNGAAITTLRDTLCC
jgi:hypothetical protein